MKNLSIFQAVFFGSLILVAAIGLFVFATFTSNGGANAVGAVTIWGTLPEEDVKAALLEDVKLDHNLKGVSYIEKSADPLPTDLAAAIATGKSPDLVIASQEELLSLRAFLTLIPHGTL